jgi:hypothetical protein
MTMVTKERDFGQLRMFILDVLRHDDIENLSSVLELLNNPGCIGWRVFWPDDFTANEVVPELRGLGSEGCVQAMQETGQGDELVPIPPEEITADDRIWFGLTDAGRKAWDAWIPPTENEG